jgi:hypothetical protein
MIIGSLPHLNAIESEVLQEDGVGLVEWEG